MKNDLKDELQEDINIARGAMKEIIENNRKLNRDILDDMGTDNFAMLEEYTILQKSILDAAKLLSDIHSVQPKTLKDISNLQDEKQKINLDELIDE